MSSSWASPDRAGRWWPLNTLPTSRPPPGRGDWSSSRARVLDGHSTSRQLSCPCPGTCAGRPLYRGCMDHGPMTLEDARALAQTAHRGQEDKLGVEYIQHVEAVA